MSPWKYPFSKSSMQRMMMLTLGVTLFVGPVGASAAEIAGGAAHEHAAAGVNVENESFANQNENAYHQQGHKQDKELEVGESRVLRQQQIHKSWGGIDSQYSPEKAAQAVQALLPQKEYEALFPVRLGSAEWHEVAKGKEYDNPNQGDYYSYQNLIGAVTEVANIKYKVRTRKGSLTAQEIYRLDKKTHTETLVVRTADFNSPENRKKKIETEIVDYGAFLKEGSKKDRKRELAALLANLSHETGGGWKGAPGGELRWGFFWNENIAGRTGQNMSPFVDPASSAQYPGFPGKRYYGRGPIMLSWNFNYGLFSSVIYGNKNVLLQNPESVAADGKLGFMTAILFWMTPQAPKPSAHDVMVGNWKPSKEQIAKGLTPPGFGITIMVLNGLEANLGEVEGSPVLRRAGHYRDITAKMGVDIKGEKVDTLGMQPF